MIPYSYDLLASGSGVTGHTAECYSYDKTIPYYKDIKMQFADQGTVCGLD
jgi:hypothetical protein